MNKIVGYGVVCYPESLPENWKESLLMLHVGFAYVLHDKDEGKPHYHVFFQGKLTKRQKDFVKTIINVGIYGVDIRHGESFMNYLTHDTDASREAGKHVYPPEAVEYSPNWCPELIEDVEETVTLTDVIRFINTGKYKDVHDVVDAMIEQGLGDKYIAKLNAPVLREYLRSSEKK